MAEFDAELTAEAQTDPSVVSQVGHTVGNTPSAADPAGVTVEEKPQPSAQPYDSFEYTAGAYGNYPNVGVAETAAAVTEALARIPAKLAVYNSQSAVFLSENGAAVVAGHTPVDPAEVVVADGGVVDAG